MKAEAILFLSKQQRVRAMHSADGKFALTMRAFDRSDPQHTEPWMLIFPGDAAAEFWQQHGDLPPGTELCVQANRLRCIQAKGKNSAEIHAWVTRIFVHPTDGKSRQSTPDKTACSPCAACAGSY